MKLIGPLLDRDDQDAAASPSVAVSAAAVAAVLVLCFLQVGAALDHAVRSRSLIAFRSMVCVMVVLLQ